VTLPALAAQNSNKDRPRAIRPRPCPPSFMRPKNYSATQIGHLMTNPYAFYAQKILSLRPLDPLAESLRPLDRGNILHAVLAEFTTQYPQNLPLDAENILLSILDKILNNLGVSDADQVICRPRLAHILKVYLGQDKAWRDDRCTVVETQEKKYSSTINVAGQEIEISARLDRMDINRMGEAIIFDYKTGTGQIKRAPVDQGTAPQLPIQAWLVARAAEQPVSGVGYWPLLARPEKFVLWEDTAIHDLVSAVDQGLPELLRVFLQATTPYWPVPDPDRDPGYNDYNHLMRRDEWDGQDEERHE
jgi:ATP-dependent helicase/nuclease subunit B